MPMNIQGLRNNVDIAFAVTEDDTIINGHVRIIDEPAYGRSFLLCIRRGHPNNTLRDCLCRHVLTRDLNTYRLVQELIYQTFDLIWHRRREEQNLTCERRHVENFLDVWNEAHIQHTVSFIDNKGLNTRHQNFASLELVNQAARCRNQNVDTFHKLAVLLSEGNTADEEGHF